MEILPQVSTTYLVLQAAAILFMVVYPLVLGWLAYRRLHVSWRYFAFGALIFFLFQLITRVPIMLGLQAVFGETLRSSQAIAVGFLVFAAVTAGLAEEIGRYVGYRWLMGKEDKTWPKGVMFGIGHGGIESILLTGGLALLGFINLVALADPAVQALIPPAQRDAVAQQLQAVASLPQWLPLLGAWERLWTLPIQIAFSVMVLQVFRRGNAGWLWLAVLGHALVDLIVPGLPLVLGGALGQVGTMLAQEAMVAVFGLLAVWIIFALRDREPLPVPEAVMPSPPALHESASSNP